MDAAPVQLAFMTAPDEDAAKDLVRRLVEEGLVACGNLVPGLTSIYRWKGRIETEPEVLIILKTTAAALPALLRRAPELHPYEVPELLVWPVEAGHPPYMRWVAECVQGGGEEENVEAKGEERGITG